MFGFLKAKRYGYESYGKIISVKDVLFLDVIPFGGARPKLPQKKVCVRYKVDDREYEVTQIINDVLPKHEAILQIDKHVRIKVLETDPKCAYISELDEMDDVVL